MKKVIDCGARLKTIIESHEILSRTAQKNLGFVNFGYNETFSDIAECNLHLGVLELLVIIALVVFTVAFIYSIYL